MAEASRWLLLLVVCLTASMPRCLVAQEGPVADTADSPQPRGAELGVDQTAGHARQLSTIRQLIDSGRYEEAEAVAKLLADSLSESDSAALERALALDLWVESRWRNGKAWHPGTLEAAQWSESLKRQLSGSVSSAAVADSLFHQARVLDEWARFAEARELYRRALVLYDQTLSPGDPKRAIAGAYLGGLLVELAQLEAARPYLEESVEQLEAVYGPDHPAVATALVPLAWLEKYERNVERAEALFQRALVTREKALGPWHPEVAEPLDGLARLLWETTSIAAGRGHAKRAEAIRLRAFGASHPSLVYNYVLLWWVGEQGEADSYLEKARVIAEETLPTDHPLQALVLSYQALGDDSAAGYSQSWSKFERALRIFEGSYGPHHWRVATVLSNMAGFWHSLGEFQKMEEVLARSRAIYEAGEVCRFPAWLMDRETDRLEAAGEIDLAEALRRGNEAIELAHQVSEPLFYLGFLYESQAERLQRAERLPEAALMYEQALEIRERHAGPEHVHLMDPLRDYAELNARMGDPDRALTLNRRALDILLSNLGPDDLQLQFSMDVEARLLWSLGQTDAAFQVAQRLETMLREIIQEAIVGLPERQSLAVLAEQSWGRDLMISAAVKEPSPERNRLVADALIRSRGTVIDSLALRHKAAHESTSPEVRRLNEDLMRSRERLARLAVGQGDARGRGERAEQIVLARREKEAAERALAAFDKDFRSQHDQSRAGLLEVAAALPGGSALVAYTRYNRFEQPRPGESPTWPPEASEAYAALVLQSDSEAVAVIDLGRAELVDRGVRTLRRLTWDLAETADRSPRRSQALYRREGEALRRLVWDPIAPLLQGAERLFLVPDGELNLLPLAALPTGDDAYLLDLAPPIQYLTSERDLLITSMSRQPADSRSLLAMGYPDYDEPDLFAALADEESEIFQLAQADRGDHEGVFRGQRASCGDFESIHFGALPGSRGEIETVERRWRSSSDAASATVLLSSRANEAAFKSQAPGREVLHLATHGFFLGGDCSPEARVAREQLLENPLVLSGLALAGANHRASAGPGEEDGIVTAEEIAALDLRSVRWAVLSGCETGVGESRAGEGVFGLRRALQIAGARTVIMSLWPVDDVAARDWMESLYRHRFADGLSTIDAVHQTNLDLLAARRDAGLSTHPFYWAGFVAAGDWR